MRSANRSDGWQPGEHLMVSSGGLRYHVVESGQGPVVVLVAGFFPDLLRAWRRVAPLLEPTPLVRRARKSRPRRPP